MLLYEVTNDIFKTEIPSVVKDQLTLEIKF